MTERVNVLIRSYNREDTRVPIYALDTGSATAYAIAPIPGIAQYRLGDIYPFKALNTNTSTTPTFAVNGLAAGTITYPDGSALVPGDIAANGFYAVIVASTTPTFHLMTAPSRSKFLQKVSTLTGAVATGTTTIPLDDTKPDQSVPEGDQYMSLTITRKSAASKLYITVTAHATNSAAAANGICVALFQDSTALALAAEWILSTGSSLGGGICYTHVMDSGATGSTTFKVRIGSNQAGTTTFNGQSGGRQYGGVMPSSIIIEEVLP
jgi:hypothetical protein